MAEFCVECWNKLNGTNEPAKNFVLSKHPDFCEGCGEWVDHVVLCQKEKPFWSRLLFPFEK